MVVESTTQRFMRYNDRRIDLLGSVIDTRPFSALTSNDGTKFVLSVAGKFHEVNREIFGPCTSDTLDW